MSNKDGRFNSVSRSFHVEVGKNANLAYTKTITFKDLWPDKEKFNEARERILAECKLRPQPEAAP